MQLLEKKRIVNGGIRTDHALRISTLGVVKAPGKTGILKSITLQVEKKIREIRKVDFSTWCMPEQPTGYIKCKNFDFL